MKTIMQRCPSFQNKSVRQKLARSYKKIKIGPKSSIRPFLHESPQLQLPRPRFVLSHKAKGLQTVGRALIILLYTL